MHRLQNPAVTRPGWMLLSIPGRSSCISLDVPQMTLVLPPDERLIDKLAERAVHD
jgi:hypothetical protein